MSFEITIWKFVISFSIFREIRPQEIESAMLYKIQTDKDGNVMKVPYYPPLVGWFVLCTWLAPITEHIYMA